MNIISLAALFVIFFLVVINQPTEREVVIVSQPSFGIRNFFLFFGVIALFILIAQMQVWISG